MADLLVRVLPFWPMNSTVDDGRAPRRGAGVDEVALLAAEEA